MDFGKFIRARRSALGLDLRTCAARCSIEVMTLSRIENERTQLTLRTAIQVCQGLEVSLAALLDEWLGHHAALLESAAALPGRTGSTPSPPEVESTGGGPASSPPRREGGRI